VRADSAEREVETRLYLRFVLTVLGVAGGGSWEGGIFGGSELDRVPVTCQSLKVNSVFPFSPAHLTSLEL